MINSTTILTRSSSKLKADNKINNTSVISTLLLAASALNDNVTNNHILKNELELDTSSDITKKAVKRFKKELEKPAAKCIKLSDNEPLDDHPKIDDQNGVNDLTPVNKTSQDLNNNNSENVINNLLTQQQPTYILESNTNCLQLHLKPDISTNSQITLKVLPLLPSHDSSSLLNQQQSNSLNINKNFNLTKTIVLNGSNINNALNASANKQSLPITYLTSPSSPIVISNYLNKKSNETGINNEQNKPPTFSSTSPSTSPSTSISTEATATTTIFNLNESNSAINNYNINGSNTGGGIYFLMQTSSDLMSQQIKSQQTLNHPILTLNKSLDINELTTNPANNIANTTFNSNNNNNNNNINSLDSSSSSTCSANSSPNASSTKVVRDERRRANHNEVERRRRDNINKWIVELSKVIPDCSNNQSKHGQSKGGILEKTVQYLNDIKQTNQHLANHIQSLHQLRDENQLLKQQNEIFKKENEFFRSKYCDTKTNIQNISNTSS